MPPFRLGELATAAAAVTLVIGGSATSDFGDPFDGVTEFLLIDEVEVIAVELRTLTDVRLLLALDGGGG